MIIWFINRKMLSKPTCEKKWFRPDPYNWLSHLCQQESDLLNDKLSVFYHTFSKADFNFMSYTQPWLLPDLLNNRKIK